MPVFLIRLESPDLTRDDGSPHYRETLGQWPSEDIARAWAVLREQEYVEFSLFDQLDPPPALPEEDTEDFGEYEAALHAWESARPANESLALALADRGARCLHDQTVPYTVTAITEVS